MKGGFDAVTDTYVTMAKQRGICADKEIVLKYVDKYYSTKDKTIFE